MKGKGKKKAQTKVPQSYSDLFPGRFIKGDQFKGQAATLTLKEVWRELMDEDEWAVILSFEGTARQIVLNKTNAECLKGMFGKRIADWLGKRVTFYPRKVKAFGQMHEAIRVLGSPDIQKDMSIEVNAGQASGTVTMKKTAATKWAPIGESAPAEEYDDFDQNGEEARQADPLTGEVPLGDDEKAAIVAQENAQAAAGGL